MVSLLGIQTLQRQQQQRMDDLRLRSAQFAGQNSNDIVSYTVIDPPDDRYYPGYSYTQADGDVKTIGPRLKDLNIPFSLYGLPIPITFGVRRLYGNLIWAVPLRENVKKKKKGGGKGGGSKSKSEEYEYFATFAVGFGYSGLGDSVSRDIIRIWADGSLIMDRRSSGQTKIEGLNYVFYNGASDQMPDPTIEEREGVGQVPAYRDMIYIVFKDLPVGAFGDRPPAISIEVGDSTSPRTSVTNIYPDLYDGSRSQNRLLTDWSRYQAYTIGDSNAIRTYDLINGTVLSAVAGNPFGAGWDTNSNPDMEESDLQLTTGIGTTNETPGYIPWLNRLICAAPGAGSSAVMLIDPASGIPSHWIGADQAVTNAAFPSNEVSASTAVLNDYPFYKGYIPTGRFYEAQLVYNLYWVDTFIFVQSTVYNDFVILHLRGKDNVLDMLTFENGTTYDEIVAGTRGIGYSDTFVVSGSTINRIRLTTLASRFVIDGNSTVNGYTNELWKTMPSGINNIWYYPLEDALIVLLDDGSFYKYNCEDGAEILATTITGSLPGAHYKNKQCSNFNNGSIAWDAGSDVREIDLVFGTVTTHSGQGGGFFASGDQYDSGSKSLVGIGTSGSGSNGSGQTQSMNNALSRLFFDRLGDDRIPLADFLEGVSIKAGYDPSEIEISPSIDDEIDGAIISNVTTFRDIMEPMSVLYRFDMVESGGKIKFTRQPLNAPATNFTIDSGDTLINSESDVGGITFQSRREEEREVPQRVNIRYIDKSLSYQWAMQFSTRSQTIETNQSNTQITYEVPIVMNAAEAKMISYRALWTAWQSRVAYSFRVSQEFLKMEPGDIGTITAVGLQFTVKAVEVTYNNDFSLSVRATGWLSDENFEVTADPGDGYTQEIPYTTGADAFIIDVPLLQPSQDLNFSGQFPVYVVISPIIQTNTWGGGSMWAAYDGYNFEEDVSSTVEGFVGVVPTPPVVPDSILQIDYDNTITVYTRQGDSTLMTSCTELEMLAGANAAAYGANGRWEIIQFQTVTDNGNGSFILSNLLRGQRGTDYAVDNHRNGDFFVLLDSSWVELITFPHADMELSFRYKGVGFGQDQATIPPSVVTLEGYGALPWPPNNLRITRSRTALTGDITIAWDRRSRTNGGLVDFGEYADLASTEANDYLVSIRRWPHYDNWTYGGGTWSPGANDPDNDVVTFEVTGATSLTLTAAQIRTAELYEFSAPDNLTNPSSTFSNVSGAYIAANETANEQIVDLGFGEFVAFKSLEIMVQQKTNLPHSTGYGPGRWTTVMIEDT